MILLDAQAATDSALVVDGAACSRHILGSMLRGYGFAQVVESGRADHARRLLEQRVFDLVVCEHHFDGESMTGQEFIDDLRLAQVLPLSTVVVMISGDADYGHVAEAAEAALDAYVLKPHTEAALLERIARARRAKRELQPMHALVERGCHLEAAQWCQQRVDARRPQWLQAARVGAELWLRVGRPHEAQRLFEVILGVRALPWARLGLARSAYEAGSVLVARRTLESLLEDQPTYADAYDVMSRVLLDAGEVEQAIGALRRASSLAPACASRQLKLGLLAFYHGDPNEALQSLQRAATVGVHSRVFDLQGMVLLAALQFDQGQGRALALSVGALKSARQQRPDSARLRRFHDTGETLLLLHQRKVPEAVRRVREAMTEVREPDFDFEAACNLLMLLARLARSEVRFDDLPEHLESIAGRFAVSRTTCDLLCHSALSDPGFERPLRRAYAHICEQAEEAVSCSLKGEPQEAVLKLLAGAEASLSSKLLDLAIHTLERHGRRVANGAALTERAMTLHHRWRAYGTQVRMPRAALQGAGASANTR